MRALAAATPIAVVVVSMVAMGWSAVRAGLVAAATSVVIAVSVFDFGSLDAPYGPARGTVGLVAEAGWITFTVVAILGPALAVHHLQARTGATDVLRGGLARLTPDPRIAGLLVAWFFCLFLEGAAGFGTPVALAAPFLVAAGFSPVSALTAALVGHAAGVSFGAVGTPVAAQVAATGFSGRELAAATVPYHAVVGWVFVGAVVVIVGRAGPGGLPWRWGAAAGLLFFVPYVVLGRFVGPELPTLGAALAGGVGFVALHRFAGRRVRGADEPPPGGAGVADLMRAGSPYLALLAVVLVTRLVPPIRDLLVGVVVEWRLFDSFGGDVRPLYHPGAILPIAFGVGVLARRAPTIEIRRTVGTTNRQLAPVVAALVAMVTVARAMSHAGMTSELAEAAAQVGAAWPLLAPAVGALGTFVTGSATASNVLFTELQEATAQAVDRPVLPLLGAQGFGAAVGNIACPHNVVAAAATVGLVGREGSVLRRTLPILLLALVLGGVVALVGVAVG